MVDYALYSGTRVLANTALAKKVISLKKVQFFVRNLHHYSPFSELFLSSRKSAEIFRRANVTSIFFCMKSW